MQSGRPWMQQPFLYDDTYKKVLIVSSAFEQALYEALKDRKIAGVGLDVYEKELLYGKIMKKQ